MKHGDFMIYGDLYDIMVGAMWGPQDSVQLVNITPITMVYGTYNELVMGVYKPTYNWGARHCVHIGIEHDLTNKSGRRMGANLVEQWIILGCSNDR